MRILAAGDIHLGRVPRHGSSHSSAWETVVSAAIEHRVDLLLLTGDVIQHEDHWLSAYGPLLGGLTRLKEAGILCIAVGGNHDWGVFPQLAKESDAIHILGEGGVWETYDYKGVRFLGWSFAASHQNTNPFEHFDQTLLEGADLTLGLLHTEVGSHRSFYAPTRTDDFLNSSVTLWALGHTHIPGFVVDKKAFYCGSPFALDPSEQGVHGAYLIERTSTTTWGEPTLIPLSPVRYESLEVDVTGLEHLNEVQAALRKAARTKAEEIDHLGDLYLTTTFTGALDPTLSLDSVMGSSEEDEGFAVTAGLTCYIRAKTINRTTVKINLEELSGSKAIDGVLAALILNDEEIASLYRSCDTESWDSTGYAALTPTELTDDEALQKGREAAMTLLASMVAQRQEEGR